VAYAAPVFRTSSSPISADKIVPLVHMSNLRLFPGSVWTSLLALPLAGLALGYAFWSGHGSAIWDIWFRPQGPNPSRSHPPHDQENQTIHTTHPSNSADEIRVPRIETTEPQAQREWTPRLEIVTQLSHERLSVSLHEYMIESPPVASPSSSDDSPVYDIPPPPYALSDGGRQRYAD
jgi:hypothetical protein